MVSRMCGMQIGEHAMRGVQLPVRRMLELHSVLDALSTICGCPPCAACPICPALYALGLSVCGGDVDVMTVLLMPILGHCAAWRCGKG